MRRGLKNGPKNEESGIVMKTQKHTSKLTNVLPVMCQTTTESVMLGLYHRYMFFENQNTDIII